MSLVASIALLLAATAPPVPGEAISPKTIAIHVFAAAVPKDDEKKALKKELRTQAETAQNAVSVLEKDASRQYGKKWPPDIRAAQEKAGFAARYAWLRVLYLEGDPRFPDSVQDVRESFAGKGMARRSGSRPAAPHVGRGRGPRGDSTTALSGRRRSRRAGVWLVRFQDTSALLPCLDLDPAGWPRGATLPP